MKHINVALFVADEGCPHRCSFCNQKTISGSVKRLDVQDVHNAVSKALGSRYETGEGEIAFFGGSFTAIEREYMLSLLKAAKEYIDKGLFKGIRISTRPDCINEEILHVLKKYGVTSIEIGCQSTDNRVLRLNERGHTAEDIFSAARLIKSFGFELGVQMMTGLYGDSDEGAIETAKTLISLNPDTARIYPTVVLEKTALHKLLEEGKYVPQTLEEAISLCSELLLMFHKNQIPVIRLGLHSGGNVEEGYIAGVYHPAFREKCESAIYLKLLRKELSETSIKNPEVFVGSSFVSQLIGQGRENIKALEAEGYSIKVKQSDTLKKYEIVLKAASGCQGEKK